MQVEIKAGLYHGLKIPNQEKHKYCPSNSWCKYMKRLPYTNTPHNLDCVFKEPLEKTYNRLSEPARLVRCLPGYTQNANESINSSLWNKCPKHKWHGRQLWCQQEIWSYGKSWAFSWQTQQERSKKEGDSGRIKQAEQRTKEKHKKYRLARQKAKQREEEHHITQEGVTYEAAGLNESQLCHTSKRKQRKT